MSFQNQKYSVFYGNPTENVPLNVMIMVLNLFAGRLLGQRQCTLKGGQYFNAKESVQCGKVYSVGKCTLGVESCFNLS